MTLENDFLFDVPYIIKLDCVNKQVYLLKSDEYITASDYDGGNQKTIESTSGRFYTKILGVFGDSLYFMNNDKSYITRMNASNRIVSESMAVERKDYYDLIVVHSSLQPTGVL